MHKLPFWVPFQVLLYDATRKLIDSRFLKKGEAIRSGEAIKIKFSIFFKYKSRYANSRLQYLENKQTFFSIKV